MKKMLMAATVPSMIGCFNMNNIHLLQDMGYEVHVACNFKDTSIWTRERTKAFIDELKSIGVRKHQVDFSRSPKDIKSIRKSFAQIQSLLKSHYYAFVHCHTPMAGLICRISCYRNHVKVIYTAHGFHFYNGAPLVNWLVYYPIEKGLSYITDTLITINKEDYKLAKNKLHAKHTVYIPGVGVDIEKYADVKIDRGQKRAELDIGIEDIMLLSVGELNKNKNHRTVVEALSQVQQHDTKQIHYCIAGIGELQDDLQEMASRLGVNLHLLGFRNDIPELLKAADVFLLPSFREGLNVSLIEAIASGLPCIVSNIRGNRDAIRGIRSIMVDPESVEDWSEAIEEILMMKNHKQAYQFSDDVVAEEIEAVYA